MRVSLRCCRFVWQIEVRAVKSALMCIVQSKDVSGEASVRCRDKFRRAALGSEHRISKSADQDRSSGCKSDKPCLPSGRVGCAVIGGYQPHQLSCSPFDRGISQRQHPPRSAASKQPSSNTTPRRRRHVLRQPPPPCSGRFPACAHSSLRQASLAHSLTMAPQAPG